MSVILCFGKGLLGLLGLPRPFLGFDAFEVGRIPSVFSLQLVVIGAVNCLFNRLEQVSGIFLQLITLLRDFFTHWNAESLGCQSPGIRHDGVLDWGL